MMKLVRGIANRDEEHIELFYGDGTKPSLWTLVALVAPGPADGFTIEFVLAADSPETQQMVRDVQRQLDFYLIEKGESDPWGYAWLFV